MLQTTGIPAKELKDHLNKVEIFHFGPMLQEEWSKLCAVSKHPTRDGLNVDLADGCQLYAATQETKFSSRPTV